MEAVLQNYAFPIFSTDCDTTEEQFKSMTEWLKHNTTPSSQVHIFMEKTAVKRAESGFGEIQGKAYKKLSRNSQGCSTHLVW